ncbi:MAG: hypothetical protein WDO14_06920 [Bacteroidota bacterium]
MKRTLLLLTIIIACSQAIAQAPMGMGTISGKTTKIDKNAVLIQGKYLYNKEWQRGAIQMRPGNVIHMKQMKVNFFTDAVEYPKGNEEMSTTLENVRKVVVFTDADSTKVEATFGVFPFGETKNPSFYQVLNDGKFQLMKHNKVGTNKMRVDPIVGQSETLYFYSAVSFYVSRDGKLIELKGLSKSNVFEVVPEAEAASEWLSSHKNKLKKEEDVVALFDYLNSQAPQGQ